MKSVDPPEGWGGDTGTWLEDLDGDGKLELILGPDQAVEPDPDPMGAPGPVDITGYRIYALQNGVYRKVGETKVVDGWAVPLDPEVVAAINPAAVPQEGLLLGGVQVPQAQGGKQLFGKSAREQRLTLYCIPPDGYDPEKVDWSSLVITGSNPPIHALDAGVDKPAPYDERVVPKGWVATAQAHQLLYLQMTRKTHPDDFSMTDDDPVLMMGPGGRLHFTCPYRVLRFDRETVLSWLAAQWRAGKGDHDMKSCFTKDGRELCYTPIGLPFTVRLHVSVGPYPVVAHGAAMLWVRN